MPQLISREELALVLDEDISVERFNALYSIARRIVQGAFPTDIEALTGPRADAVAGVLVSVMSRILANPKGARTLSAGSAAVTFGGHDAEITRIFTLNEDERADLEAAARTLGGTSSAAFTIRPGSR